ncbi:chaperonin 10-like protein [Mycena epipterygia]|nr:chaperonin 10-like protein [Mycena epipterygia]
MSTHTAIAALEKGQFDAIEVETEKPSAGQVLIKVAYASMVAFDTYVTDVGFAVVQFPVILGFNASGTIAEVGAGVIGLAVGDRVTGFALFGQGRKDGFKGAMQEFVVLPDYLWAKMRILALDAAAMVPDNCVTTFYALFDQVNLPIRVFDHARPTSSATARSHSRST